jgi:hypothetical protein
MKLAGFLFMPAGWLLVVCTLVLLPPGPARAIFILAGTALEAAGIAMVARGFAAGDRDQE